MIPLWMVVTAAILAVLLLVVTVWRLALAVTRRQVRREMGAAPAEKAPAAAYGVGDDYYSPGNSE